MTLSIHEHTYKRYSVFDSENSSRKENTFEYPYIAIFREIENNLEIGIDDLTSVAEVKAAASLSIIKNSKRIMELIELYKSCTKENK